MKKTIALILSVLMIAAMVPFSAFAGRFADVADGKWYSEGISFCAANGYMDGVAEGKFDRSSNLTRAMFMTILAKIDGVDLSAYNGRTLFSDVAVGKWYTAAITWAAENNLASGIGDSVFGYKNNITREQMALILYGYTNYKGLDTTASADVSKFDDSARIHSWALDAVKWAVASELISGTGETILDPRGTCTRAQAAVIIRAYVLGFLSDCEHEWVDPTCTEVGYCSKCSLKSGTELGHDFPEHLCTESVKCSRCDVMSEITEHILTEPSCTEDSTCTVCGYTAVFAPGHTTENGICERCGEGIFPSAFDQLFYHLVKDGEPSYNLGNPSFNYITEDEESKIHLVVSLDNNVEFADHIYWQLDVYDYINNTRYTVNTSILGPDQKEYKLHSDCAYLYENSNYYGDLIYELNGKFNPQEVSKDGYFKMTGGQLGNFNVTKDEAIMMSEELCNLMLYIADYLIQENAGVSLTDFGFNMTSFYE